MTSIVKHLSLALSVFGAVCGAGNLHAAQIQGVSIAAYSSQYSTPPTVDSVTNLVSNAGLFGDAHVSVPGGGMWYSGTGAAGTNFVTFNLGGVYTVNAMKVWNYNDASSGANANIGVSNASISYSTDGVHFTTNIVSQNFIRGQGLVNTFGLPFGQTIAMPTPITAQYVRINVRTNWAANSTGAGLSKVRFISNTNPPTILSASQNYGSNQITIVFSESVDAASATTLANYSISGSQAATISSVSMGEYADRVVLQTTPLLGNNYSVHVSGVYDEALTATVTNNSTVPVKSEVFLWLQAGQGVSTTPVDGGQMLTSWNDQSPYGHNALPANLFNFYTNQPFLANGAINGQPAIAFYGTNVMQIPNDPANPINGDMTLFMVMVKSTTATAGGPISKTGGYGGGNNSNLYAAPFDFNFNNAGDGKPVFAFGNGNLSPNNISSPTAITANTPFIVAASVTATNSGSITVNGSQYIVGAFSAAPQDGGNPIYLGVRGDGLITPSTLAYSGYIAEVILIRGTITPNDFSNIDDYLSTKYSIPLNPPGIAEQPANATARVGQTATFWVNVTNIYNVGTPGNVPAGTIPLGGGLYAQPFTYQWQANGVPIPGATNAVYTTPNLTLSENNSRYTVTVSSTLGSGSVNSTAATLTVVPDTTAPTVASASKITGSVTSISVLFSKPVDSVTGLNAANYSLNNGVSVVSAAAGNTPNQVLLTTTTLNTNTAYLLTVQNVQDQFNNVMVAATVPVMPAGMTMWLREDAGLVTNSSAAYPGQFEVDAWLDQSGHGNNAVTYAVPAANRPWAGIDPVNNAPGVMYTVGNKDYMIVNNSPSIALAGDVTIYVVANVGPDYTTYRQILGKNSGGNASPYEVNLATGTGRLRFSRGDGVAPGTSTAQSGSAVPTLNTPNVISTIGGPGLAVNSYVNGNTLAYSGNFTGPFGDNGTPLYLGTRNSFDLFMGGDIQEVMIFSNSISASDRFNVDNYLAAKYFTFTSTGPANATANAGTTATFSVTASQGSAHLAYQWMETPAGSLTPTNIAGATNTTYTTGTVMAGDNGDTFSVAVSIPGTLTTNVAGPATLTVNVAPPQVLTVGEPIWSTNSILVIFQEPVNPTTATDVANYSLNNGATVLSAVMRAPNEVYLTTSPLVPGTAYTLTVKNVQDQFGAVMSPASLPSTVYPAAPVLWLEANAGLSTNSDGTVYGWADQSGNGNDFNNISGNPYCPLLVNDAINGLPMLQFTGSNQTYLADFYPQPSMGQTGDMTIFTVADFANFQNITNGTDNPPGGAAIISKTDPSNTGSAAPYDYYVYYKAPYVPYFLRGNGTTGSTFAGGQRSPTAGVPHIMGVTMQGSTINYWLDGALNGVVNSGGVAITDNGGPVYIGYRADGGVRLTGGMAELIMFGTALSSNDMVSVENYLGTKYGLITSPPISISSTNSAGTNNVVISWQQQWPFVLQSTPSLSPAVWSALSSPVTSTNAATVTVPATNGAQFYRLQYLTPP